jgi:UDP-glucuronate decarboxylase
LFFDYLRQHGVDIKVARIFNTYGPRMHWGDGRVVPNFIVQALLGEPITIYGNGQQTRAFCYVDDLVEGLIRLMDSPKDFTGPVNLGNPNECSVRALADLVLEMTGSDVALTQISLPQDDPRRRKPDISIAKSVLGWEPKVSLRAGLGLTIAYFQQAVGRSLVAKAAG